MNEQILKQIGMTQGEVRVYLALLDLGSTPTGNIIKKSNITSSKVYQILEKLEQKGLVSHVVKNNVKYFQVAEAKRLLDYMNEKEKQLQKDIGEIEKLVPELEKKRSEFHELQETTMFKGEKGLLSAIEEQISELKKGEESVIFGARGPFGKKNENLIKQFYKEKDKRGIRTRLIYNSNFKEIKELYKGLKFVEVRFIDYITPSTISVTKNSVLLLTYGENATQVLIRNKTLAESFYFFFESMWNIGK